MSERKPAAVRRGLALYPGIYPWIVLAASLDVMMTWIILHQGGREVNAVADAIIGRYGLPGVVIFKFGIVVFVIGLCEIVGRRRRAVGRGLAIAAVALNTFPVVVGVTHLIRGL